MNGEQTKGRHDRSGQKGDSMKDRLVRRGCRAVTEVDSKNEVKHIEKKDRPCILAL